MPDHEVSSKGTSIGTAKFAPKLMTLKLIMFSNLYPLLNTAFINLGRAQFLCDLITGVPIDICAHIFQTIGKTTAWTAARTCLPFCSLLIKIMVLEGVHPPTDGKVLAHHHYAWYLFKHVKVTPLKHLRVNFSLMPLHPVMAQLHLCIPRLLLPFLLSYRRLAFSMNNLAIKMTGWVSCLRICICVLPDLERFSTLSTIKSKCVSRPLRHS